MIQYITFDVKHPVLLPFPPQNIFLGEDIRKQLPKESAEFDDVNIKWKNIMSRMNKDPNALRGTHHEGILDTLNDMNLKLEEIQKSLGKISFHVLQHLNSIYHARSSAIPSAVTDQPCHHLLSISVAFIDYSCLNILTCFMKY